MILKICKKCGEEKSLEYFHKLKNGKYGVHSHCIPCYRLLHRNYHKKYANECRQYVLRSKERAKVERQKRIDFVNQIKLDAGCKDCGVKYPDEPWLFDFDHLGNKSFTIANGVRNNKQLPELMEEIKKCEVVCLICHRRRTMKRLQCKEVGLKKCL